jgi:hypothetical protein
MTQDVIFSLLRNTEKIVSRLFGDSEKPEIRKVFFLGTDVPLFGKRLHNLTNKKAILTGSCICSAFEIEIDLPTRRSSLHL